jgi:hypothetical protein
MAEPAVSRTDGSLIRRDAGIEMIGDEHVLSDVGPKIDKRTPVNINHAITIALVILCCAGCTDNSTNIVNEGQFYPLTVGNYWKYKTISYDSAGGNPVTGSSIWLEKVISDTLMNGERWSYVMSEQDSFAYAVPFCNTNEGVKTGWGDTPLLRYKYPAKKNDAFKYGRDTVRVIAVDEPVSTLLATFNCIVYRQLLDPHPQGWIYLTTYISPGIGKVKMEVSVTTDSATYIKRLELSLFEYYVF